MKPAIILFFFVLAAVTVSSALLFDIPQDEYRNIEIISGENMDVNLDTAVVVDTATQRLTYTWAFPNDDSIRDSPKNKDEDFSYTEESEDENLLSTPLGLGIIIVSSILMVGAIVLAVTNTREKPARQTEEDKTIPVGAAEDDRTETERSESEERETGEGSTVDSQGV